MNFKRRLVGTKKGGDCRETATRGFWKFDLGGTMDNQLFTKIPPKSICFPWGASVEKSEVKVRTQL